MTFRLSVHVSTQYGSGGWSCVQKGGGVILTASWSLSFSSFSTVVRQSHKMADSKSNSDKLCGGCKQTGTKICSGCKQIYYCSQQCQKDHWKAHKSECNKIRKQNKLKQQKSNKTPSKKKTTLNNTIAANMKLQYDKENKKRRTPRIKVTKAVNGIFKVKLLNEFLRDKKNNIQFQFDYKYLFCSNPLNDTQKQQWISNTFTTSLIQENGLFAVRMPLNLKGYYIKCRLRARLILNPASKQCTEKTRDDIVESKWFEFSKEYKVSIPSSMIGTEFDVGDIVKYRPEDDYCISFNSAEILEKLENGYVKLKEIKSADIPGLKIKTDPFILHQSRISQRIIYKVVIYWILQI